VRQVSPDLDYLAHLARESSRFGVAITQAAPDTQVPSCPDWNADDLLWHLGAVQWFWGTVVRDGLTGEQAEARKPPRPAGRDALLAFYDRSSRELGQALAAASPDSPAWTWSDDHTVGFIRRRQAHEALMHRVDAELTAGDRTPLDPILSTDGVTEALSLMYGGAPSWGTFTPGPAGTVRLRADDTGHQWLVALGRFTGTDPDGTSYDEPDIHLAGDDPQAWASAEVSGTAGDLDCWLWHRAPLTPVARSGDQQALDHFDAAIGPGIT
jgi:uncharacterized protein (TIGR03083 family)